MNNHKTGCVFDRSGLAALSDFQTEVCRTIFSALEKKQSEFLGKAKEFRSEEYKWPNDPLHCWSRIWEYPYVYFHLSRYIESLAGDSQPVVADVGSGVTFFPFALAQLGYELICTDIDPVCEKDILQARKCVSHLPGDVHFRLIVNERLPFDDEECDVIYCISVLEHIPDFENTVREMARILKPGGLCLITCDLELNPRGNTQLDIEQHERLTFAIGKEFHLVYPERTIHPADVLTNINSPYPYSYSYARIVIQLIKQKILKPLLGKKPGDLSALSPPYLAALGLVLQKNE